MKASRVRTNGQSSASRLLIEATLSILRLLAVLTGIIVIMYLTDRSIFADELLSNYFAYYQDLAAAAAMIVALSAVTIAARYMVPIATLPALGRWRIVLLAASTTALCYAGTYALFGNYGLSMDEFMAGFDARIFARGRLFATIPEHWRDYAHALQPTFLKTIPGELAWSSSYLPGNAAIRALFSPVDAALEAPVLAGLSAILVWLVARKLEPEDAEFATVAVLLFVTSSQFLIMAMTPYAMTAHLALNLAWLWLALHDRRWSRFAAVTISFVAGGLHQLVFHPLFTAPFLLWFWWSGRKGLAFFYFLAIALFSLFWVSYWPIAMDIAAPASAQHSPDAAGASFVTHVLQLISNALEPASIAYAFDNLLRLIVWQNPLTWVLTAAACLTLRRQPAIVLTMLGGFVLTVGAATFVLPYQGHGWGYRYAHGLLGSLALLGAFGWRTVRDSAQAQAGHLRGIAGVSAAASLLVLLPLHAFQASAFARPYRTADALLSRQDADLVIIVQDGRWYAEDLVRNDPFLKQRPLRLLARNLSTTQVQALCSRYRAHVIGPDSPELAGLRVYRVPATSAVVESRLRQLRRAGCDGEPAAVAHPRKQPARVPTPARPPPSTHQPESVNLRAAPSPTLSSQAF